MEKSKKKNILYRLFKRRETSVFIIIIIAVIIVQFLQPKFLNSSNINSMAISIAADGFFAIALTLALILGGIDLSVGGVAAMTCVISGYFTIAGVNIWVSILIALFCGLLIGLFNGLMISKIGLPPFIVTLSAQGISRGIAYILTEGSPLSLSGHLPESFRKLATGNILGIPMLFIIFMIFLVIVYVLLNYSNIFRRIFYVGSNENAAKLSAINVDKVKVGVYLTTALLASISGVLSLARFNVATPELSVGAENTGISAAVIGGTSMAGGSGGVLGSFLGLALLKVVNSSLVMLNISVYWQNFVQGLILILAVTVDYLSHKDINIGKFFKISSKSK